MRLLDLIAKKRDGGRHGAEELRFIAEAAARGSAPDYQLSAWLMAVCCRGMSRAEAVALTWEMAASGRRLDLGRLSAPAVDKHSTGGVGDGVSIALAPLLASAGLAVPMMSGRGLGHTGGTLDKLESIPGFKVRLSVPEIERQVSKIGVCMFGQSEDLAPADRKLYHLRDVTATIPCLPLIVSSILSKKAAEDLDALVLDVKFGSGAIFKDPGEAQGLAKALVATAKLLGIKTVALLTDMEQPLGRSIGNALEIRQAVEVLRGDKGASDYLECLLALGSWMVYLGGASRSLEEARGVLEARLSDGRALEAFRRMVRAQGGDPRVADDFGVLPKAAASSPAPAPRSGYVRRLDARGVGEAAVLLGAGRQVMDDTLDYGAGIYLEKKVGDRVSSGETVARLYGGDDAKLEKARERFLSGLEIGASRPKRRPLIRRILR
ncbi:MAG: thymidine phosphorylase [Elusimicrobia bacterium]|nr:thymidine phosphorylase [Elusimicrobiota bacterium]